MKRYRRRLPYWDIIQEAPVFVTWRLWGSLLDSTRMGPVYLRQDKIAGIVRDHLPALVADVSVL